MGIVQDGEGAYFSQQSPGNLVKFTFSFLYKKNQ